MVYQLLAFHSSIRGEQEENQSKLWNGFEVMEFQAAHPSHDMETSASASSNGFRVLGDGHVEEDNRLSCD